MSTITNKHIEMPEIDHFYIDMNSLVHHAVNQVNKKMTLKLSNE